MKRVSEQSETLFSFLGCAYRNLLSQAQEFFGTWSTSGNRQGGNRLRWFQSWPQSSLAINFTLQNKIQTTLT
jgi:hypothetical protein